MGLDEFLNSVPAEEGGQFTYASLGELSALSVDDAGLLANEWEDWTDERMKNFLTRLTGLAEDDALLEFDTVFIAALESEHEDARSMAIRGLSECADRTLGARFSKLLRKDEAITVREMAARGLARFVEMAVERKLSTKEGARIVAALEACLSDPSEGEHVRLRALEAIAPVGGDTVTTRIRDVYLSGDPAAMQSAVFCMARTNDPRWLPEVLKELESDDAVLRYEAAFALGEIGEEGHALHLSSALEDEDGDVVSAAASSLSKLGGPTAKKMLEAAASGDDPVQMKAAGNALREMKLEDVLFESETGILGITPEELMGAAGDDDSDEIDAEDPAYSDTDLNINFPDDFDFGENEDTLEGFLVDFDDDFDRQLDSDD